MIARDDIIIAARELLDHVWSDPPKSIRRSLPYISAYGRYILQEIIAQMYTNPNEPERILKDMVLRMDIYTEQYAETHKKQDINPFEVFHDTLLVLYFNLAGERISASYGYDKFIM